MLMPFQMKASLQSIPTCGDETTMKYSLTLQDRLTQFIEKCHKVLQTAKEKCTMQSE